MAAMTLTADGLLPLPREIRDSLGLRPGDRVDLRLRDDGVVELAPEQEHPRPYEAIADLIGCVRGGPPDLSENTGELLAAHQTGHQAFYQGEQDNAKNMDNKPCDHASSRVDLPRAS